jgi:hypothetical protein
LERQRLGPTHERDDHERVVETAVDAVGNAEVALVSGLWVTTSDDVSAALLVRSCFEGAWFSPEEIERVEAGAPVPVKTLMAHVRVLTYVLTANAGLEFLRMDGTEYLGQAVASALELAQLAVEPEAQDLRPAAVTALERLRILALQVLDGPWRCTDPWSCSE